MSTQTPVATRGQSLPLNRWLASVVLAALGLYFAQRGLSISQARAVLRQAQVPSLLAAIPCLTLAYVVRAVRWQHSFSRADRQNGLQHIFGILLVGFMLNNLLPARSGDLARIWLMRRYNRVNTATTFATLLVERVLDGTALGVIGVLSLRASYGQAFPWFDQVTWLFCLIFSALLLLPACHNHLAQFVERVAQRYPGRLSAAISRNLAGALEHTGRLMSPASLLRIVPLTILVWSFEAMSCSLVMHAFELRTAMSQITGFLAIINFASLIPTPGGLGVVELAGTSALAYSGVARDTAFVFVATLHALQYAFCLVLGSGYAWRLYGQPAPEL